MKNKIKLFQVPFITKGVTFSTDDLNNRIKTFITEIKVLIPKIEHFSCDLYCEIFLEKDFICLEMYLLKQAQLCLPHINDITLNEAKILIVEELMKLPLNINLIALETFSIGHESEIIINDDEKKIKKLMKNKRKNTIKFLLEDEEISLGFPELAPYVIDKTKQLIRFKIEYIHKDHFKINLPSKTKRKEVSYLKVGNKIYDDNFYSNCTEALRMNRMIEVSAYSYRDSATNEILMYLLVA